MKTVSSGKTRGTHPRHRKKKKKKKYVKLTKRLNKQIKTTSHLTQNELELITSTQSIVPCQMNNEKIFYAIIKKNKG